MTTAARLWFIVISFSTTNELFTVARQFTFELPDNDLFCFYEDFNVTRVYRFTYNVLYGGDNDVDCKVESPTAMILYHRSRAQGDEFKFQSSRGSFKFCFSNEFSSFTHKVVSFDLVEDTGHNKAVERPNANTLIESMMQNILTSLEVTEKYQRIYRVGEARNRYWAEQLNERVAWWSAIHSLVMVFSAIGQVLILRAFFAERRTTSSYERRAGSSLTNIANAPKYNSIPTVTCMPDQPHAVPLTY